MKETLLYPIGCRPACRIAAKKLQEAGIPLTDHPCPEVTHLLLDTPAFCQLPLRDVLDTLPEDITVIGGKLNDPCLHNYLCIDLLKDEQYLAKNAAITAQCAVTLAASSLQCTLQDANTLIIGWGRIGKCLARILRGMDADPVILSRKEKDRAILSALGFRTIAPSELPANLPDFGLILNTAPELVINEAASGLCRNAVKLDLASEPGIDGENVIRARGLPGRYAPESSGRLIAETVLRHMKEASQCE